MSAGAHVNLGGCSAGMGSGAEGGMCESDHLWEGKGGGRFIKDCGEGIMAFVGTVGESWVVQIVGLKGAKHLGEAAGGAACLECIKREGSRLG